ncbi:XRE family transcriptional regulator [Solwaraspora sp. WMMB335]|uniref:XRE family transcriptional regulator n=1 Tax=Solwaraspora sp. WMMB335 TaxID=3404118 RepID=UPI003B922995
MSEPEDRPRRSALADRLNHLFAVVIPAGRTRPYSNPEVARAVSASGEVQISPQYLWALRNGSRDNPTLKQIEALAAFFGVPPAYFLSDDKAADIDEQLMLLAAVRDADVREIMRRSTTLSRPDRLAVLRIMQRLTGDATGRPETPAS